MSSAPETKSGFFERHPKIAITIAGGILVLCYLEWMALTSMAGRIALPGFSLP